MIAAFTFTDGALMPLLFIVAYFVPDTIHLLRTIDDIPLLAVLRIPRGMYTSARTSKTRHTYSLSGRPRVSTVYLVEFLSQVY